MYLSEVELSVEGGVARLQRDVEAGDGEVVRALRQRDDEAMTQRAHHERMRGAERGEGGEAVRGQVAQRGVAETRVERHVAVGAYDERVVARRQPHVGAGAAHVHNQSDVHVHEARLHREKSDAPRLRRRARLPHAVLQLHSHLTIASVTT